MSASSPRTAPDVASARLPWPFVAGGLLVLLHLLVGLVTLVWTPYGVADMVGGRLEGPSLAHLAGTDRLGRDLFSQIMIGARIAMFVGCGAVAIAAGIGVTIGILAAFATRTLDDIIAAALDILIAFPTLLLAMLIVASSSGASLGTAILAIGLAGSAIVARLTRISPSGCLPWTTSRRRAFPARAGRPSCASTCCPISGRR